MQGVDALRTPEEAFARVPDFGYPPKYVDELRGFEGLRLAFIDEGPRDARAVFLCLHGTPTWSFLYRKMIPVFLTGGGRVVVPDLFGCGRSDKPVDETIHTFRFHYDALLRLIEHLDLQRITLVVQGVGGMLGLTLPPETPARFARLLAMNTALVAGDVPLGDNLLAWRDFASREPDLDVAAFMKAATPILGETEADAYAAPFPDRRYKAAIPGLARVIPTEPSADGALLARRARAWWRTAWSGPAFLAVGLRMPFLAAPAMEYLRSVIRDAPQPVVYSEGGFYLPEWGDEVARAALEAFARWEPTV
ncbi:MAG TPA: haloalkane dehalogenase [Candidatus Limnocylindria bacterium]|jgi:haloalkane dehalogenase|nr:haloalkane dehalogenase [Candidatus Limnocylindria bacterium]